MATALEALDRARVFLNDTGGQLYTNAVLLPLLQVANEELGNKFLIHGIPVQKEIDTYKTITAGDTTYTPLPDDFITPVNLWQRPINQDVDFSLMVRKVWEPATTYDATVLGVWDWRNQEIIFQPASVNVQVRLDYNKMLTEITTAGDTLEVIGSLNYLAYKTAELAARHIGENPIKAAEMKEEANSALADIEIIAVRNMQFTPSRRKRFSPFRRNYSRRA